MSTIDQIAAANGLNNILNRQQAKQAGLVKELATGETNDSIAQALATPFETESQTLPVVQQNIALAGNVLSTSSQALSSVTANLTQALATASQALSAPPQAQKVLAQQFNALVGQTKGFVDSATVNGLNLVSSNSKPMTVNTTTEGGQITVANAPSSAQDLGVTKLGSGGWSSASAIQGSINQIQNALNQISSTQSKIGAAQSSLTFAQQLNQTFQQAASSSAATLVGVDIGSVAAGMKQAQAQQILGVDALNEYYESKKAVIGLLDPVTGKRE